MFPHRGRLLSLATVVLLLTLNAQAQDTVLQAPGHSERDMWEYLVEGKLGSLAGPMNLTGSLDVEGLAMAEVKGVEGPRATIEWNSQLSVAGNITLPPEFDSNTAYVDGTISTTQVQTRESSFFLPLSIRDTTDFDLTVSYIVPVPYSAGLELLMDITPTPSFPEYPLGVGEKEVEFIAHVESALSMSFFGFSIENSSTGDLTSSLRLNITPASEIRVPAGEFRAVRVVSSADEGLVPGLFPFPFAGALQVGYYSNGGR